MKIIKIVLMLTMVLGCSSTGGYYRNEANVYSCLAGETKDRSYCDKIKNKDQKHFCLAKYYNRPDYCERIRNPKERSFCITIAK
jgi:hypothetical protein